MAKGPSPLYPRRDYGRVRIGSRDFAPLAERMRAAIAREREIPAALAAGKANIEHPPRAFVEIAIRGAAGSINFYREGAPKAFAAVEDRG